MHPQWLAFTSVFSLLICYLAMIHIKVDRSNGNPTAHELKLQREHPDYTSKNGRVEAGITLWERLLRVLVQAVTLEVHRKVMPRTTGQARLCPLSSYQAERAPRTQNSKTQK